MFTWIIIFLVTAVLFVAIGIWMIATGKARATDNPSPASVPGGNQVDQAGTIAGAPGSRPQPQQLVSGRSLGCMLIFSLFWVSFSLSGLVFFVGQLIEEWQVYTVLKDVGVTTEAVIVDRRVDEGTEDDTYYVTYQYTAPLPQGDRQKFSREEQVIGEEYEALPPETRVPILYDPAAPQTARLKASFGPPFFGAFLSCFLGLFVLSGLALLAWAGVSLRRLILLTFYGQIISGVVVERWVETGSESNSYCISYRFQPPQPGSVSQQVTQAEVNYKAYQKFNVGDPVQICYLPYKPEVCRLKF